MQCPDYHTHTARCGHAVGTAEEYVATAFLRKLSAIGIADHLPLLPEEENSLAMSICSLGDYVNDVLALKKQHPGYVLLGIEADYRPHTITEVKALLKNYPFDYVIGSVHFLGQWGFDDERQMDGYSTRDLDEVWREYLELVGDAAESGAFTILGHIDLVKKFGYQPSPSLDAELDRLAQRIAQAGTLVEINTSGLHKPIKEAYPSLDILRRLYKAGVNITFGSDAHHPSEVGRDFAHAVELAQTAGYSQFASLELDANGRRARVKLNPLSALKSLSSLPPEPRPL